MTGAPLRKPVEAKVQAGSLSAAAAGVVLWVLQQYVFGGGDVPGGVVSLVYLAVPGVVALAAGWLAPHTPLPPLPEMPAAPAAPAAAGQPPAG